MRLERSFGQYPPEVISFRTPEPIRIASEVGQFVTPREFILFSRVDEGKHIEAPDQAPEIDQTTETIKTKHNGDWEPFSQEPTGDNRFLNFYNGNYAANMEINRKRAEQVIKVAGLEGDIVLISLSMSRTRSLEANPDGSVATKRGLLWDEKPEDVENPYRRATSIPEGWRIEICDQRIRDELSEKYSGEKLQKKFAAKFNQHLRAGIWQAVWKEKLTTAKDKTLIYKAFVSSLGMGYTFSNYAINRDYRVLIVGFSANFLLAYPLSNFLTIALEGSTRRNLRRNLTSLYERFMPLVEVDRAARAFAYLNIKGRNLVRLR